METAIKQRSWGRWIMKACALLLGLWIFSAASAFAEHPDLILVGENGSVNWTRGEVLARGIVISTEKGQSSDQARDAALGAARADALRNLLETVKAIRIDSDITVEDYARSSEEIMARLEGMVSEAPVVEPVNHSSDGAVEVTVRLSIYEGFAQLLLPQEIKQVEPVKTVAKDSRTAENPPALPARTENEIFTGLVVDARGLQAVPAMVPRVLDEEGKEVYGPAFVSREFAVSQGISGYSRDLSAAQKSQRVEDRPLTVKGLRTPQPGVPDIIISNADASKLRRSSENLSFLRRCRVIIVTG